MIRESTNSSAAAYAYCCSAVAQAHPAVSAIHACPTGADDQEHPLSCQCSSVVAAGARDGLT